MGQIIATDGTDFAIVSNNRLLCMLFAALLLRTSVQGSSLARCVLQIARLNSSLAKSRQQHCSLVRMA